MIVRPTPPPRRQRPEPAPQPPLLIVTSPLVWLVTVAWKPLLILAGLFVVAVVLLAMIAAPMARESNRRAEATVTASFATAYPRSGP